jgi:hypothetical protein
MACFAARAPVIGDEAPPVGSAAAPPTVRASTSRMCGAPDRPSSANDAVITASCGERLKSATAVRPPPSGRAHTSAPPALRIRLARAPRASWLIASASSFVSRAVVQASEDSAGTLPPNISGDGRMLHRVMMDTCRLRLRAVGPAACTGQRGPRYPSGSMSASGQWPRVR